MRFTKESLNLENGVTKEWLITNGIGGYSASSIIGANTRKYHGLLVAPLIPPAKRYLILSKLDESIEFNLVKHDLFTNVGKEYISDGYKYLTEFEKSFLPIFKYQVEDTKITKVVCMEYGKNTVVVYYKVVNGNHKSRVTLTPLVNCRDFHGVYKNDFKIKQNVYKNKVKVVLDDYMDVPIYMNIDKGEYIQYDNNMFRNMFYLEEEKRGFDPEENHAIPGSYVIDIEPNTEECFAFVCSLEENIEELDVKNVINDEVIRLGKLFNNSGLIDLKNNNKSLNEILMDNLVKEYIVATDNFIVYRPNFGLHTVIAGYPWFLDWGRDTLLSFEGLLLVTRRFDIAKEVIRTIIRDVKFGLVPNGYSGHNNRPLYNSCDASLLLFEAVQKYLDYTRDYKFVSEEVYPKMVDIIENYIHGINVDDNNIYLDGDNLLVSGTSDTQNTWMDAKYDGVAVTPRNGKAVEINALWYNANRIMEKLSKRFGYRKDAKHYRKLADECQIAFKNNFYCEEKECLYDVLGDSKVRPNQLFAFSLTYPVMNFNTVEARNTIRTVEDKLLNDYGLKTLAEGEKNYVSVYEGGPEKRDKSYHQGITWPWLLGLYYNTLKNQYVMTKDKEEKKAVGYKLKMFIQRTTDIFKKEIEENGCIGSIAEIYDSVSPQLPKGTFAQAWSVAETFRIILGK